MRALFFVNSFAGGGAEKVCLNLAEALDRMGIQSDFVTVYAAKSDSDIPDHVEFCSLGMDEQTALPWKLLGMRKGISRINRFLKGKEYVLITAHLPMAQMLASWTRAGNRCLYVMHVTQRLTDRRHFRLYKTGLQMFLKGKKIVTVSKGLKRELTIRYKIPADQVTAIYNPCPDRYGR